MSPKLPAPFSEPIGSGGAFFDFGNDGRLDLYLVHNAEPSQLFANDGPGRFREISAANRAFCGEASVGRGLVCGDIDNDGGLDLLLVGIWRVGTVVGQQCRRARSLAGHPCC